MNDALKSGSDSNVHDDGISRENERKREKSDEIKEVGVDTLEEKVRKCHFEKRSRPHRLGRGKDRISI